MAAQGSGSGEAGPGLETVFVTAPGAFALGSELFDCDPAYENPLTWRSLSANGEEYDHLESREHSVSSRP